MTSQPSWVPRGSLADVAYARMLEWIMDGTLSSGDSIRLAHLAEKLGISQTPLRESLARLEGQGLVYRLPMRGFKVADPLSSDDLNSLMDARLVLEPAIAALAAKNVTPADIAALTATWEAGNAAEIGFRFEGYRAYLELSEHFHDLIGEISRNQFLREAAKALPTHLQRFRLFGTEGVTDREVALKEHHAILEAIARGDSAAASREMATHVRAVRERSNDGAVAAAEGALHSSDLS